MWFYYAFESSILNYSLRQREREIKETDSVSVFVILSLLPLCHKLFEAL